MHATVLFLVATLLARRLNFPWMSAAAKAATSATFVQDAASTCAFAGDVALAFEHNAAGTIAFAASHLFNIANWGFFPGMHPELCSWWSAVVKILLLLLGLAMSHCVPPGNLYRVYVFALLSATHVAIVTQNTSRAVGMVLFVVADVGVGIEISKQGTIETWQWALPLYYFAQWMML